MYVDICYGPAVCTSTILRERVGNDVEFLFSIREELRVRDIEANH